jgi:O-methyltransferase involved in polyketide biosynthesis
VCLAGHVQVGELAPVEETALLTVYARALDSRRPRPILGDILADEVVGKIDYDFAGLGVMGSTERFVALRAKMLDARIRAFVATHPDAVVVDLGAGLSSAAYRVDPPATVDWYSVDLPAVISMRETLLPSREGSHSVAASLGEHDWPVAIPANRPTMIVADGLFAFISEPTIVAVVRRITEHFGSGVLAFYDYGKVSRTGRAIGGLLPTSKRMATLLSTAWAFDGFTDAHHPETWHRSLQLIEEASAMNEPDVVFFPLFWRLAARMSTYIPAIARKARVLCFQF